MNAQNKLYLYDNVKEQAIIGKAKKEKAMLLILNSWQKGKKIAKFVIFACNYVVPKCNAAEIPQ